MRKSQKEMADGLGMCENAYRRIEISEVDPKTEKIVKLAEFAGQTEDTMFKIIRNTRRAANEKKRA